MAKQYREKPATGYEYVTAVKNLFQYTLLICEKLPQVWYEYLLKQWMKSARKLVTHAVKANSIYVSRQYQTDEEFTKAIRKREKKLEKMLRELKVYNERFSEVMDQIDIKREEIYRLKDEISDMIAKSFIENGGELGELKINVGHSEYAYVTINGNSQKKINVTSKQKDHIIDLYIEAEKQIKEKLKKDRSILKNINVPAS